MTSANFYNLELERTAAKTLQTPVSFVGSYKWIWQENARGKSAGVKIGVGALLVLFWLIVTLQVYWVVFASIIGIFVWWWYTQNRRHSIHDARAAIVGRDRPQPSS